MAWLAPERRDASPHPDARACPAALSVLIVAPHLLMCVHPSVERSLAHPTLLASHAPTTPSLSLLHVATGVVAIFPLFHGNALHS
jgi:hypothetical protein